MSGTLEHPVRCAECARWRRGTCTVAHRPAPEVKECGCLYYERRDSND